MVKDCKAGVRRMLSLALAMLGGPSVLLLDEPSFGELLLSKSPLFHLLVVLCPRLLPVLGCVPFAATG